MHFSLVQLTVALLVGALLPACLSDSYAIRRGELLRISTLSPENRGIHVRTTQQTSFSDSYEEPDPTPPETDRTSGSGILILTGPGPFPHHHYASGPRASRAARSSRGQPARLRKGGGRSGGGSGKASSSQGNDASAAAAIALAALVVGTGAFSIAALTEGSRFDGWAWLPPEQPLLLKPKGGTPFWVPLSELTRQDAELAEGAVVMPNQAQLLERAPLDRVGASTSLEVGGAGMRSSRSATNGGFAARYALGGFPLDWLGILGNGGIGVGDDGGTLFDARLGVEMRLMPLRLGQVHWGGYGELGHAWLMHDVTGGTARGQGMYSGLGALMEIELTTRLGLLLRGGATWLPRYDLVGRSPDEPRVFPEVTLGVTVY